MKKLLSALLLISSLIVLAHCEGLGKKAFKKPKVTVAQVSLDKVSLDGATLLFNLNVDNPNSYDLDIKSLSYEVELSGKPFTTGTFDKGAKLSAGKISIVQLPLKVKFADLFRTAGEMLVNDSTPYRLKGTVKVGIIDIPFDKAGELKLTGKSK